jgi:hypothetical protein
MSSAATARTSTGKLIESPMRSTSVRSRPIASGTAGRGIAYSIS